MHDLAPFIEAGDFRRVGEAEAIVEGLAASAPSDLDRGAVLYRLWRVADDHEGAGSAGM